ncbi:MAG: RluA family pseudouridine synthase [Oscillospiraceae bacterium]|nr:RluA family pseudouridine synthase [Oscillospiraceae bacterium]
MTDRDILYRDPWILVCKKPPGMLSASGETDLPHRLAVLLADQGEPNDIFVVHRLDRETGGIIVYARTAEAAAALSKSMRTGKVEKTYLAVIHGAPPAKTGVLRDLLFRDAAKNRSFVVKRRRKGVREAVLHYETLGTAVREAESISLVKIKLETGRTHQIRVQFASRGEPLLGDGKYGAGCDTCRLALWSAALVFPHPEDGGPVAFSCPPPGTFPWTAFPPDVLS